jgi:hypothetical protein
MRIHIAYLLLCMSDDTAYTEFILRTPSNSALYMYMYIGQAYTGQAYTGQAYTDRNHHTSIS